MCKRLWGFRVANTETSPVTVLWVGLAAAFVSGLAAPLVIPEAMGLPPAIVLGLVAVIWCRLDARQHAIPWTPAWTYFTFFIAIVTVPAYLLRARRRYALLAMVKALAYGVAAWFVAVCGLLLTI